MKVHDFRDHVLGGDTGTAYGLSQTTEGVSDGDVLLATHEGVTVAAVMVAAWPTLLNVVPLDDVEGVAFHRLASDANWVDLEGGRYAASMVAALEALEAAGSVS